jgi:hypothetical protein
MGSRGRLVGVLLSPLALLLAMPLVSGPVHPGRRALETPTSQPSRSAKKSPTPAASSAAGGVDPNLPLIVGETRRLAARAIDDTAAADHAAALVALGRRLVGTPARAIPAGSMPMERLVLDLTAVDPLSYVEQLLALVNSRQVRTRTEAVDRFSDHVRRLRYGGGRVDRCARLRHPRLWALAAARRGYLVDLTPFLPGARQRQVPLKDLFQSVPAGATPFSGAPAPCPPPGSAVLHLAELPLAAVPAAAASLRSGDLFVLVSRSPDRQAPGIGLLDLEGGRLGALVVQPGRGVVREPDLLQVARNRTGTSGVSFLRSLPNTDGRADP